MIYLLDTNICIYLLKGNQGLIEKSRAIGPSSLAICHSVLAELFFGVYHSEQVDKNLVRLGLFKAPLMLLAENEQSACLFGIWKSKLRKEGKPIDDFDLLIASVALANDCTLVTNNSAHFERISDLRLENWVSS